MTRRTKELEGSTLSIRDIAKFTSVVAILGILADATIGHGLTWENDPYWTYWVTKTFLIATVFGLGSLWFGIGRLRGALITLVHTLILTVYYWTLSPIGLPSSPHWLDLEHTWLTGVPIHFGVIYLGYLVAMWLFSPQRKQLASPPIAPKVFATKVLFMSLLIVVVAGGLSNIVLGEFTGITWYVVRLLITVPFIIMWRAIAGRDRLDSVIGGIVLALIWAGYSQYLGPSGLPDVDNLRLLSTAPPPAAAHWLGYNQLWLVSFPIYLSAMVSLLTLGSYQTLHEKLLKPATVSALIITLVVLAAAWAVPHEDRGSTSRLNATGKALIENGPYYNNRFSPGTAEISVVATDSGGRVSPLPPRDGVNIKATINSDGHTYTITATEPMVEDPMGQFTTWWGVATDVDHHGRSGIGTDKLPNIHSKLAVFGMGDIVKDGELVATGVPVHAMTAEQGLAGGSRLEVDIGDPRASPILALPSGHLRVLWPAYSGEITDSHVSKYIIGDVVLASSLLGAFWLASPRRAIAS
jgi:hypothetical protein